MALLVALALLAFMLLSAPPALAQTVDYDADNDRLIEIDTAAKLNAIRHDLNGDGLQGSVGATDWMVHTAAFPTPSSTQCPTSCQGYELTANLNLAADYATWTPIGGTFNTTLDGNGYTISGLNVSAGGYAGLIGFLGGSGVIRNLGIISPTVTATSSSSYAGGLVGNIDNGGRVEASYVRGGRITANATPAWIGGLAGEADTGSTVRASYASAEVTTAQTTGVRLGGLLGGLDGALSDSYAYGPVVHSSASNPRGGLIGDLRASASIADSYCDTVASMQSDSSCTGVAANAYTGNLPTGQTTSQLRRPTGYTGIYHNWNRDLDNDKVPDYLWNFGASADYPTLNTPTQRAAAIPAATDYDADDDGLIEIRTAAQLNAIRWDLDGDGDPVTAAHVYSTAFGGRTHTADAMTGLMGCPVADGCAGYELAANLNLAADYPAWTPIGSDANVYDTVFDGNGFAISGLNVDAAVAGLFARLGGSGVLRNLGIVSPAVRVSGAYGGGLAGRTDAGSAIDASYVSGGAITVAGGTMRVGGLVGYHSGVIRASYATAELNKADPCAGCNSIRVGGLAGQIDGGTIIASYAAGANRAAGLNSFIGGLVGQISGATITDSYCDSSVAVAASCSGDATVVAGYTTSQLKRPTGYDGIYRNWNIDLDGDPATDDDPWDFGTERHYPLLKIDQDGDGRATCREFRGQPCYRAPTPPPYNPAHDHPEIYTNPRHEMSVSCAVQTTGAGDAAQTTSTLTFDLGSYTRPITLALSLWDSDVFRSLQSQGIAMPELRQDGQTATVEVVTDPAQTRFRLDSQYGLNLVLGYADCHTDDP